jgi:carbon monoxide dehydrogenase subunit G
MPKVSARESWLVGAEPEKVYRVLLDPTHHKRILPDAFVRYESEGEGIVSFALKVAGITREFRVEVQDTIRLVPIPKGSDA